MRPLDHDVQAIGLGTFLEDDVASQEVVVLGRRHHPGHLVGGELGEELDVLEQVGVHHDGGHGTHTRGVHGHRAGAGPRSAPSQGSGGTGGGPVQCAVAPTVQRVFDDDATVPPAAEGAVWVIVVAAGRGERFGSAKQFEELAGRRVVDWSIDAARSVADGVVLVVPPEAAAEIEPAVDAVVAGGDTRSASVRAGLEPSLTTPPSSSCTTRARPVASRRLFRSVVDAVVAGADVVVPTISVVDTIRRRDGASVDRDELGAVQTPQGFAAGALRTRPRRRARGHRRCLAGRGPGWQAADRAGRALEPRRSPNPTTCWSPTRCSDVVSEALMDIRVGQGFDVHPFVDDPDRVLVLGGVPSTAPPPWGATATPTWSPTPVPTRSSVRQAWATSAQHFPDTDPAFAGADSIDLLGRVARLVASRGLDAGQRRLLGGHRAPKLAPGAARCRPGWPRRSAHRCRSRADARKGWAPSVAPRAWPAGRSR